LSGAKVEGTVKGAWASPEETDRFWMLGGALGASSSAV
jgi:hypothetical protein